MEQIVQTEEEMKTLGERLGARLQGGEVIELIGDLGAGKTTLTKGIARGLGVDEAVQSPSFTLSRVYETPHGMQLAHYDFYRLTDPGILADELSDIVGQNGMVTVIEWAGVVEDVLPKERITITITPFEENGRKVIVKGRNI